MTFNATSEMTAEPPKAESPKRKRRWFQFRLRSLMLLTFLVAVGMATWIVPNRDRAARQKAAVDALRKNNVSNVDVEYDYQFDSSGNWRPNPEIPGPAWLRGLLGNDFFTSVHAVNFGQARAVRLEGLESLGEVDTLVVRMGHLTDAELEHVRPLIKLTVVELNDNQITDVGLDHFAKMSRLRSLSLSGNPITDAGLKRLTQFKSLNFLNLFGTRITDSGLEEIASMSGLQFLSLGNTSISDTGLDRLRGLKNLKTLDVRSTQVTDEGVSRLTRELPNCKVYR